MTTPYNTNPTELFTPFLPSTYIVPESDDRLDIFLVDKLSQFADVINDKTIGSFTQQSENFNGEKFIYKNPKIIRNGYQTLAYIPSLPNKAPLILTKTSNPAYPILYVNPEFVVTEVFGTASKPCSAVGANDGDYFTFTAEGHKDIEFTMSDTQIVITTKKDMTAYSCFIIIKYLRNGF